MEKSRADTATRKKARYDKDLEIGMKSVARSKASYDKDIAKSLADSAARSKANYEKDVETSRICKSQRYVILCVCSLFDIISCQGTL